MVRKKSLAEAIKGCSLGRLFGVNMALLRDHFWLHKKKYANLHMNAEEFKDLDDEYAMKCVYLNVPSSQLLLTVASEG